MPSLRDTIAELASRLASEVLHAIREAPMGELLFELDSGGTNSGGTRGRSGRARRAAGSRGAPGGSSGSEVAAVRGGRGRSRGGARLPRRSADQIEGVVERIVALLRANPKGLRSEHLRDQLGLSAKELPRPLKEAERNKQIWKEGEKRATTYFAGAPASASAKASSAPPAEKAPARGAKRKARQGGKRSKSGEGAAKAKRKAAPPASAPAPSSSSSSSSSSKPPQESAT